jgi:hypothetical protein
MKNEKNAVALCCKFVNFLFEIVSLLLLIGEDYYLFCKKNGLLQIE